MTRLGVIARGVLRRLPEAMLLVAIGGLAVVAGASALPQLKQAGVLRVAAGETPPQMDYSGSGREAAVIRAALRETRGPENIEFHVGPFSRHWEVYQNDDRLDAVTTVPSGLDLEGYNSQTYIEYQNGVIYRRSDFPEGLGDQPIAALRGKRVVAFAGASRILGITGDVPNFLSYMEYDDQYVQSAMLVRGVVDVVIADRLVIDEYNRQIMGPGYAELSKNLVFDPVFCPTAYHMAFRRDEMRAAFDAGLARIKASGEWAELNARYQRAAAMGEVTRSPAGCAS